MNSKQREQNMRIIRTDERKPGDLDKQEEDWCYNGLDCCVTREVFDVIYPQLDNTTATTYAFSKALQGPILDMRLRGIRVDTARRAEVADQLHATADSLTENLDRIVTLGVGLPDFNPSSTRDLQELFYNRLEIPPIRKQGRPTVDANALEKLEQYTVARQIARHILAIRGIYKRLDVLKTPLDPDGRIRTSYNIAGTSTGRLSSSLSEFGTGGNLQNVEEWLRSIFIADKGMKFCKADAKSGESYVVGGIEWNLFRDGTYLEAVESGDIHTAVARICWSNLGWTGDLKRDKVLAERPYYRHYSYRFMCKKLGHGSNYGGQPFTLATQSRLPIRVVQDFQPVYFTAFPAHQQWQRHVADEVARRGNLTSLTGRKRWFHGRRNDPSTIREAIAFDPQCSLADIVNGAMLRLWSAKIAILVANDHDALTFTYPEEMEDEVVPAIREALPRAVPLAGGRELLIPYDCKVGWNRGDFSEENPEGLKDYEGTDKRRRQAETSILDRPLKRIK